MIESARTSSLLSVTGWALILGIMGLALWFGVEYGEMIHKKAEQWTHTWWLVPILICAQAFPFALALPGSIMFLVIGLLYDPLPATAMITAGGVLGSTLAYFLSGRLASNWVARAQRGRMYQILRRNTNFMMLCAMRTLPGFPHSIINYGSGLLDVPLKRFVISATIGYMLKGLLYASILHNVMDIEEGREMISLEVLWPLIVLAGLFIAGFILHNRLSRPQADAR
ncbi:TVP38/TMEM64 family protein [Desulfonatronum parangueonense]